MFFSPARLCWVDGKKNKLCSHQSKDKSHSIDKEVMDIINKVPDVAKFESIHFADANIPSSLKGFAEPFRGPSQPLFSARDIVRTIVDQAFLILNEKKASNDTRKFFYESLSKAAFSLLMIRTIHPLSVEGIRPIKLYGEYLIKGCISQEDLLKASEAIFQIISIKQYEEKKGAAASTYSSGKTMNLSSTLSLERIDEKLLNYLLHGTPRGKGGKKKKRQKGGSGEHRHPD